MVLWEVEVNGNEVTEEYPKGACGPSKPETCLGECIQPRGRMSRESRSQPRHM
jgi:hypothetical protein